MSITTPYPLSIQRGMSRFNGHVFLAPGRLYFICTKKGGAWGQAIGLQFGLIGAAIAAATAPKPGEAPPVIDENALREAVAANDGSLIMEASDIQAIKYTWFWRFMKYQGNTYGLPNGLSKELSNALGAWCQAHNVVNKGLVKG